MEEMTRRVNTLKVTKYTGLKLKLHARGFEGRLFGRIIYEWAMSNLSLR